MKEITAARFHLYALFLQSGTKSAYHFQGPLQYEQLSPTHTRFFFHGVELLAVCQLPDVEVLHGATTLSVQLGVMLTL